MKRFLCAALCALLLFSLSGAALAADADTIRISSAEELMELSALCTSDTWSEGKTIVLTRDISLTGCDFSAIPLLAGTFDGQGHSILGLSFAADGSTQGLFRMVLKTGIVKNLTVSGTIHATGTGENIGGIAGVNYGTIENCRFDGDILAQTAVGGIVGRNAEGALVTGCTSSGTIAGYHRAGGITGENNGVLNECENHMSVNTEYITVEQTSQSRSFDISSLTLQEETIIDITDLGGIAGLNTSVIKYCDNYGAVGYPHTGYNVGGIAGRQSGRILGCTNGGEVTARKDVGGIAGQVEPYASWNVTGTGLGEVQSQLYRLESLTRTTLDDLGDSQSDARVLMQEILRLLGNCSDIIGGMYPDVPWPSPGDGDESDTGDGGDAGSGGDTGGDTPGGWHDPDDGSMDDLSDNLQQIVTLLGQMTDVIASDAVIDDMQSVVSQLMNVSTAIINMMYGLSSTSVQVEDVSDASSDEDALCLITQCANTASVTADTNAGGIAGNVSLDISFDREDTLDLSSAVLGSGKYEIFARISDCENRSSVEASKSCAGGIAGRMEYGLAVSCASVGEVSAAEEYAGGIVGHSSASVRDCLARVNLSAKRYLGGIAGLGRDIAACRAMPHFADYAEFRGAVAGYTDGTVSENVYSDSTVGGVDGFSFAGQCDELPYEEFIKQPDTPEFFRSIGITFVADGETIETVEVPFGGAIESLPSIPDKDGMYWQWDEFDSDAIYYSLTVEGEYVRPVTTIATGEDEPRFLAEGVFRDGQTLLAVPFSPDAAALGLDTETILEACTIRISDYDEPVTIRMLSPETGSLYTLADGTLTPLTYSRDGSYIVFRLDNGASIVYVAQKSSYTGWIIAGVGVLAALTIGTVRIVRKQRKKKSLTNS